MITQFAIGLLLILATVIVASVAFLILESVLNRLRPWLIRPPHAPKLVTVLSLSLVWTTVMICAGVWIWAGAFMVLDIFQNREEAVYFALVAFTTLGFGDILLPDEWRLLSGIAATNGLLNFGLLTAMLVETLRSIRVEQRETRAQD